MKTNRYHIAALLVVLLIIGVLFAGCGEEEEVRWVAKPSVVIDGVMYGTTGRTATYRTSETPDNGGYYDGEITSSVEGHEYPAEDGQSNFGAGYFYRYGEENTVEIFMDDRQWIIFEVYEDK